MTRRYSNSNTDLYRVDSGSELEVESVNEAVERGRRILTAARADAERLLRETQEIVASDREKARQEGFLQGQREALGPLLQKVSQDRAILQSQTQAVVELACSIAGEVISSEVREHRASIIKRIERGLKDLAQARQVTLVVSEGDAPFVRSHLEQLSTSQGRPLELTIREEKSLANGDARLETDYAVVESKLANHLEAIRFHLLQVVAEDEFQSNPEASPVRSVNQAAHILVNDD